MTIIGIILHDLSIKLIKNHNSNGSSPNNFVGSPNSSLSRSI